MEREYIVEGILVLIVVALVIVVTVTSYAKYSEDIDRIADEVLGDLSLKQQKLSAATSFNSILSSFDNCLKTGEKCVCGLNYFRLPLGYHIDFRHEEGGVKARVYNNEEALILEGVQIPNIQVGLVEHWGIEQHENLYIDGLFCIKPKNVDLVSSETGKWGVKEHGTAYEGQQWEFYGEGINYKRRDGTKEENRRILDVYKYDKNTLCFITKKVESVTGSIPSDQTQQAGIIAALKPRDVSIGSLTITEYQSDNDIYELLSKLPVCSVDAAGAVCPEFDAKVGFELFDSMTVSTKQAEKEYSQSMYDVSSSVSLDPFLIKAIIMASSGFDLRYISADGKVGLMGLGVERAKAMGLTVPDYGVGCKKDAESSCQFDADERFNTEKALNAAIKNLAESKTKLKNSGLCSLQNVAASYLVGAERVISQQTVPEEAKDFVKEVMRYYKLLTGRRTPSVTEGRGSGIKVVIDPGHGGSAPGACGGSFCEKDINLKISEMLASKLNAYGFTTILTRTKEGWHPQMQGDCPSCRGTFSNKMQADIFISNHNNARGKAGSGRLVMYPGVATYGSCGGRKNTCGPGNERCLESKELAEEIRAKLQATNPNGRYSLKSNARWGACSRYGALIKQDHPSIIMEYARINDPDLKDPEELDTLVQAVADGINSYVQKNQGKFPDRFKNEGEVELKEDYLEEEEDSSDEESEEEDEGYAQPSGCESVAPNGDLTIVTNKACISAALIQKVLQDANSPAVDAAQDLYDLGVQYGVDPAIALAFFKKESSLGTAGKCNSPTISHNIGNIRYTEERCTETYVTSECDKSGFRPFCKFATWRDGIDAWYKTITGPDYAGGGLTTLRKVLPRYSPTNPSRYADQVISFVNTWREEERKRGGQ